MKSSQVTELLMLLHQARMDFAKTLPPIPEYVAPVQGIPSEKRATEIVKEMENLAYANGFIAGLDKAVAIIESLQDKD